MLIKNTFTNQSLKDLQGAWHDIAKIFQRMCTTERRMFDDGTIQEQIKIKSLPVATFLNCVSHIVNNINNEFGAMEIRSLYDALDPTNPHVNNPPSASTETYEYCCNTLYERTVIFAGVYYVISIEDPELQDVLTTLYKQIHYKDAHPYIDCFVFELRKKMTTGEDDATIKEDLIPPHLIPDVNALMNGYRDLKPYTRLKKFRQIAIAIEQLPQNCKSTKTDTLHLVIICAIKCLKRTYNLSEDAYIPDNEKVTISTLLEEYKKTATTDENGCVAAFIERVIRSKEPSAHDLMYLELLQKAQRPKSSHSIPSAENDVSQVLSSEVTEEPDTIQRGPRKQALFQNQDGKKDDKRTQEEADRVKRYLTAHHLGGKNSVLDSSQKTKINIVVATFWQHWNDKKWVNENFHGAAFCRFLIDDCNLQCGVEEKVFSQTIRGIIESGRDSETFANVADFF